MAVFIDGCFWHSCPIHGSMPKANAVFWRAKIERNRARDAEADRSLRALGWKVVRVWAHDVEKRIDKAVDRVAHALGRTRVKHAGLAVRRHARQPR